LAKAGNRKMAVNKAVKKDNGQVNFIRFMSFKCFGFSVYQRLKANHAN
tara:strand:+ start:516 stop:659 length:144 start_codon:yes stop_codon:yes gene_type:complete